MHTVENVADFYKEIFEATPEYQDVAKKYLDIASDIMDNCTDPEDPIVVVDHMLEHHKDVVVGMFDMMDAVTEKAMAEYQIELISEHFQPSEEFDYDETELVSVMYHRILDNFPDRWRSLRQINRPWF